LALGKFRWLVGCLGLLLSGFRLLVGPLVFFGAYCSATRLCEECGGLVFGMVQFVLGYRAGEVHHEEPHRGEVLMWKEQKLSVAIMLRTSLFPYNRARLRNTTPSPVPVFESLALSFLHALAAESFVLPSYAQVMAEHAIGVLTTC
jgi:hypothetical protein